MPTAADATAPLRVSQRRPLACRECTKRKRKCDKQVPCSRCRRLNLHCSVEIVQLRRNTVQHASEIQFLASVLSDLESVSNGQLTETTKRIRDRIAHLQTGYENEPLDQTNMCLAHEEFKPQRDHEEPPPRLPEASLETTDPPLLTAIEHLAWCRNSAGCFPHRGCRCQHRRESPGLLSPSDGNFQLSGSTLEPLVSLPKVADAQKLIKFHISHLTWHHNCFHGATFLDQCELFWKTGTCDHPLWIALYLSVLSCTINSILNSDKLRIFVDVNFQALQSAQQLFSGMMQTLYHCDFLKNLSIYSVQATVISTEVAHNLGLSQLNATLFNAAVRIAECLGIHKIQDHPLPHARTREEWEERVEREVGRRVWCQMIIQDHFAIPFTDTYSISPMHYSTGRPLNADDHELIDLPKETPTISTYIRTLVELAALMPGLVDGLGPMSNRRPRREQYERILEIDQRMRKIVQNIPSFLLRPDPLKEAEISWLGIARRSLAITAAEKIIMIHRLFLFRSFHDSTYDHSRRTCVAAAMTILREHETIVNEDDLSIWTHTAFAITAAVILCFEVNTAAVGINNGMIEAYREAVIGARERLAFRRCDVLAQRGVALIDAIFIAEQTSPGNAERSQRATNYFNQVSENFSTLSRPGFGVDMGNMPLGNFFGNSPEDATEDDTGEIQLVMGQEEVDFDAWFNGIFNDFSSTQL
ncbi:hypothetical protein N7492_006866 [Penicillium capsulatum]|uniref:Zn(2)-C6 fungal-type domain-containing protein n=1 Tax=Penicillium capsulatum TaxID=69766 RepID=A0A9W9HYR0_9EURO|nr:hypothetical protein N7492_006866 [Penicillium capsulatum]KAJ6116700.1 hypothetical protein N7512_006425 [Penicillium capsulatum]